MRHWVAVKQGSENPSVEKIWDNSVPLVLCWTDGWKSDGGEGTDWEAPIKFWRIWPAKLEMLAFIKISTDGCVLLEDYMFSFGDLYFQDG